VPLHKLKLVFLPMSLFLAVNPRPDIKTEVMGILPLYPDFQIKTIFGWYGNTPF
jgi:hypothetical protein